MKAFDKLHHKAIEAVNVATDQKTHHEAEIYLRGLRDGYSVGTGVHKGDLIMRGDMYYINQGYTRPMCGGVFLDKEADDDAS